MDKIDSFNNPFIKLFISVFLLFSCDTSQLRNTNDTIDKSESFLSIFKDIDAKNKHFYSSFNDENGDLIETTFKGIPIDVNKFNFCDNDSFFTNIKAAKKGIDTIHAIAKFEISNQFTGLIFRLRSQYDESLIGLMLWDKNQKKIISSFPLADSFGDAGWYFDKESWITEFEFNKSLKIVSRQKDFVPKEDFIDVNDMDSIITDSLWISHLVNWKFISTNLKKSDTIYFKLKCWEYYN